MKDYSKMDKEQLLIELTFLNRCYEVAVDSNKKLQEQLRLCGVTNWLAIEKEQPKHGETVLTYTPKTEITEEQHRIITFGGLKRGFPVGITHWRVMDKPTCL